MNFLRYSFIFFLSFFCLVNFLSATDAQLAAHKDLSFDESLRHLVLNALKKQQNSSSTSSYAQDEFDKTMQMAKNYYSYDQLLLQKKISEALLKKLNGEPTNSFFVTKLKQGLGNAAMLAAEWTAALLFMIVAFKVSLKVAPSLITGMIFDGLSFFNPVSYAAKTVKDSVSGTFGKFFGATTGYLKTSAPAKVACAFGRLAKKIVGKS